MFANFVPVLQRTGAPGVWELPLTVGPAVQGTARLQMLSAGTVLGGGPQVLATSNVLRFTAR